MKGIIDRLARSERIGGIIFSFVLFALQVLLTGRARRLPAFSNRVAEKDLTVQIRLKDGSRGRYYISKGGAISSEPGIHASPDVSVVFGNVRVALNMLVPPRD